MYHPSSGIRYRALSAIGYQALLPQWASSLFTYGPCAACCLDRSPPFESKERDECPSSLRLVRGRAGACPMLPDTLPRLRPLRLVAAPRAAIVGHGAGKALLRDRLCTPDAGKGDQASRERAPIHGVVVGHDVGERPEDLHDPLPGHLLL